MSRLVYTRPTHTLRSYKLVLDPWINPLELLLGQLATYDLSYPWPQFAGREVYWTHLGRIAVWSVLQSWGVGRGDEVLVPSYNCGSEIDPILCLGSEVRMYRIKSNLEIDLEDIRRQVSPKTKVLYVTHFFGWPQQIEPIQEEIRKRGIRILEDCALSLFSCDEGVDRGIGRMGDAAIYSFPKTLAVPEGGAITSSTPLSNDIHLDNLPSTALVLRRCLPFLKRSFLKRIPGAQCLHKILDRGIVESDSISNATKKPDIPENYYFDERKCNDGMSSLTKGLLKRVDRRKVKRIRQENYRFLLERIQSLPGIRVLKPDLPEEVCPLSMPIQVKDREKLRRALMARGIYTYPWWAGYHRKLDWSEFPEARTLKDTVLTLPVHQCLGPQHMEYITKVLRQACCKSQVS